MVHMTAPLTSKITIIMIVASFLWLLPADSVAAADPIPQGAITIEFETVASGLTAPVGVTHAGDGSGRLFIIEQTGQIRVVQDDVLLPTPFLDISSKLPELDPFFDERGLLGLAFHPEYESNGRFFVRYSATRAGAPTEPCFGTSRGCHEEILAEYAVSNGDPNFSDIDSEIIRFRVDEPQFNHNAGELAFGPDGFLYFSLGDGGGAHDGLADSPPSHGPIGNAQNIETPLGAILRINVDKGTICHKSKRTLEVGAAAIQAHLAHGDSPGACGGGGTSLYLIPTNNPFVGQPGLDEIYAYGLRNPYKFSFDDGPGGDGSLFLADAGQNLFEEVNIIERGGNYGWPIREGFHCFDPFDPINPPGTCPDTGPLGEPLIDPIVQYSHPGSGFDPEGGIVVIGGFVYRGSGFPSLEGTYVFGNFAQQFVVPSGSLYYVEDPLGNNPEIQQFQIGHDDRAYGLFLKGFGEDEDGEMYVAGSTALAPTGSTGVIQRIVAPALLDVVIGESTVFIPRADECGQSQGRTCESLVGDVATDAMRNTYGTDFAITNSGGLRADLTCPVVDNPTDFCPPNALPNFQITGGQVLTVLPSGNSVATLSVDGAELKTYLERGVSAMPVISGRFAQVSGLCFDYDIDGAVGSRVTGAVWQAPDGSCTGPVVDLTSAATFTLAINDFIAAGGDGYPVVTDRIVTRDFMDRVVADFIAATSPISPVVQGRIDCTGLTCPVPLP